MLREKDERGTFYYLLVFPSRFLSFFLLIFLSLFFSFCLLFVSFSYSKFDVPVLLAGVILNNRKHKGMDLFGCVSFFFWTKKKRGSERGVRERGERGMRERGGRGVSERSERDEREA